MYFVFRYLVHKTIKKKGFLNSVKSIKPFTERYSQRISKIFLHKLIVYSFLDNLLQKSDLYAMAPFETNPNNTLQLQI